jgi:hypothetical protein
MILGIHATLGVFLIVASRNPTPGARPGKLEQA